VDAHVLRDAAGSAAVVDRLAGDTAARQSDAGRELGLFGPGGDPALVMSGVPTWLRLLLTVLRPFTPT
jgi:hypothetical protein